MVVQVAQINPRHVAHALVLLALHRRNHLAHRPHHPAQHQQVALELVNPVDRPALRLLQDHPLQLLRAVAVVFQDRETAVHDRVHQRIHQEAGVVGAQPRALRLNPLADPVPQVAARLLKRQHRRVAQEERHLLAGQDALLQAQRARHREQARPHRRVLVAVGLHLWALRHVEQVLDRQRVQFVFGRQPVDHAHVRQPVQVDPAHHRPLRPMPGEELVQVIDLLRPYLAGAVIDAGQVRFLPAAGQVGDFAQFHARRVAWATFDAL